MSREHPLAPHRVVPFAVIVLLGLVALLAVKGPVWYQRFYHPLRYESVIAQNARANGLDPYLVAAVINVESGFDADDVSPREAVGLMQILPSTAREVAERHGLGQVPTAASLEDPGLNITVGTWHLADLRGQYTDERQVLAAYNAGSGNVEVWRKRASARKVDFMDAVAFSETRKYVGDVLSQRAIYARLYPDAFK